MQEIAALRGGKCLSKNYKGSLTKLIWRCEKGHIWDMTPAIVNQGGWCRQCNAAKRQRLNLEEMQKIAENKGGRCISDNYLNCTTKLEWQCKEGHIWKTQPAYVKQGTWCPYCGGTKKATIEKMQEIAQSRGGKCLSKEYINNRTKLKWQCSQKHIWEARPGDVQQGAWCPYCAGVAKPTIEEIKEMAEKVGGKCLSTDYTNTNTKLKWQCHLGHMWYSTPHSMIAGAWCPYCYGNVKLTIEDMYELAASKGGKCISEKYINKETHLTWQCKNGHTWKATPGSIKNQGTWCPVCVLKKSGKNNKRGTIQQMQKIAAKRKGVCLSDQYINSGTKLKWRCELGHSWESIPESIRRGSWCPLCARNKQKTRKSAPIKN